jgi:hypothetical protein
MQTSKRKFFTLLSAAVLMALAVFLFATGATNAGARPQEVTGANNHIITLDQATKMIQNYAAAPRYSVKGGYFDRSIFDKILAQKDCIGVRCYYAQKDDGSPSIVLVGVDSQGKDIAAGVLGDDWIPCPPMCGIASPLYK